MTSDPTENGDIDQAWAAGMSRRSITSRWITAAVAVAIGVGTTIAGEYAAIGVLILAMSVACVALIHHRTLSAVIEHDIGTSVSVIAGEHLTRIRASLAGALVAQMAFWVFVGCGVFFLLAGLSGEVLVLGSSREISPTFTTVFGMVGGGFFAGYALYEILFLLISPDHRTWSMRLDIDGIEIIRGWHILYTTWNDLISVDPVPEPKTSLLPAYSVRLRHRIATSTLGTKDYTIRGHWIPINPQHFVRSLRDYHQHPDLRTELGHPDSVNRITRPT